MAVSEERRCEHGDTFHLRNISFFSYWTQCKQCGLILSPQYSGFGDRRITQFAFLAYMLVSYFFYFGIFLIISPIMVSGIDVLSSYTLAGLLLFIPFLLLLLALQSIIRRFQKEGAITTCPKCNGPMRVITHDIYLYFFLFLIHILYISTILNETGIYFYNNSHVPINLWFLVILAGLIIFIILLFRKIGAQIMSGYKMNTRVWLGEVLAVFIYIALNTLFLVTTTNINILFSLNLFYNFTFVISFYFPAFLIGAIIYKLAQCYLLNVNKSWAVQILIAIGFIIVPFYIWGLIGIYLNGIYSIIFGEIIPIFLISLLLGTGIVSLLRKYFITFGGSSKGFYQRMFLTIGTCILGGFILIEPIYYLFSGKLLLDYLSESAFFIVMIVFLAGVLVLLCAELLSNWMSIQTSWGKRLEKSLGSLIYPILMGFIIIGFSLGFPYLLSLFSSTLYIPDHILSVNIFTLKVTFMGSFIIGLVLGVLFNRKTNA